MKYNRNFPPLKWPPDKGLGQPVRDYKDTFSAVTVLKERFFKKVENHENSTKD